MTANNHPAHGPVSLDRLHQIRQYIERNNQYQNGGNRAYILADMLNVIDEVLASRNAEPVFFIEVDGDDWIQAGRIPGSTFDFNNLPDGINKLYAAPPAPDSEAQATLKRLAVILHGSETDLNLLTVTAQSLMDRCRADGAPAPVIPDENGLLPCPCCGEKAEFDYDDDNLNWISCNVCGISTDTVYHTDVDARDKLRAVWNRRAAMLQDGNSPVIPDSCIPVSEQMPEGMKTVITSNGFDIGQGWWDGECWKSFDCHDVVPGKVTHWMPLPAAPQQEVKSALEHGMQRYSGAMQKMSEGD